MTTVSPLRHGGFKLALSSISTKWDAKRLSIHSRYLRLGTAVLDTARNNFGEQQTEAFKVQVERLLLAIQLLKVQIHDEMARDLRLEFLKTLDAAQKEYFLKNNNPEPTMNLNRVEKREQLNFLQIREVVDALDRDLEDLKAKVVIVRKYLLAATTQQETERTVEKWKLKTSALEDEVKGLRLRAISAMAGEEKSSDDSPLNNGMAVGTKRSHPITFFHKKSNAPLLSLDSIGSLLLLMALLYSVWLCFWACYYYNGPERRQEAYP
jgi:hypothetical protein